MANTLKGKVAIVTGGTRGIGAAIVRRLSEEGADVAFSFAGSLDRANELVKEIELRGGRALATKADSAIAQEVSDFVNAAYKHFGRLDILVNSAGVSLMGNVSDPGADIGEFDRQFAINVKAVSTAVRTAIPLLPSGGRIISIGTVFADRTPMAGWGDYAASKAAVAGYTHGWARDLGPRNITVNNVQPGPIDTDGNPESSAHAPMLAQMTALGRYGKASEIASVVAFLAGPDASYITGTTLNVDGGMLA
jgi:3-oxoacyl-[acyl-carrier protein] reductase